MCMVCYYGGAGIPANIRSCPTRPYTDPGNGQELIEGYAQPAVPYGKLLHIELLPKSVIRKKYFFQRATYCSCNNDSKGGGYRHGNYHLEKCNYAHSSHGDRHYFDIAWDPEEEICVFCGILFPGIIASNVLCVIYIC